jgi:hypothetical protein
MGSLLLLALLVSACGPTGSVESPPASRPAAPPGPAGVRPGTIELHRWREPAELVVIDPSGVALGPEGEPLAHYLFVSRDRFQDLHFFLRSYAPFREATSRGELAFGGKGAGAAGAVEKRMILEWTRAVAAEVAAGRSGGAYGMVFAWHRGGAVGDCDDLSVYLTGEVRAGSCSWGEEVRGRLAPEVLARVYGWFDGLAPFQSGGEEGGGASREPARLVFAGQGRKAATAEEMAEIRGLAPALHRELAGRRPEAAQPPPSPVDTEGTPPPGSKPAPTAPIAPVFSGRLLLPPESVQSGPPPAAIPEDLQPPPVPKEGTPPP